MSMTGYPKNYNYIDHTVDELGNTTYFNYDLNTGILNDTTAPDGTKTIHTYNPTTLALTGTRVEGASPNVSYMYDKNELTGISVASNMGIRPGFLFKKDKFGRTTKVVQAIFNGANITEGNALVENIYHENRGLLRNSKYGNNQTVAYSYDRLDRMTDIWYFDTPRYSTIYDKSGNVAAVIDRNNINGYSNPLETKYQYDLADRLIQMTSNNGFTSKGYRYDKNNKLITYSNALRNENDRDVPYNLVTSYGYAYNNINAVEKEEIKNFTSNMATIKHSYDQLGRSFLTHHNYGNDIAHNIYSRPVFKDIGTNGKTTNQISQYLVNLSSGPCEYTFGYEYDTLGNIKKYSYNNSPITYTYDKLNQLKTSSKNGVTTSYTYDIRGNITNVKENGNDLEKTFKYGDSGLNISDVLTEFCEKTLSDSMTKTYTSDKIGNPTKINYNYRHFYASELDNSYALNLEWQMGRRLSKITAKDKNNATMGTPIYYYYNADGIRTAKTGTINGNNKRVEYILNGDQIRYEKRYNGNKVLTDIFEYIYDSNGSVIYLKHRTMQIIMHNLQMSQNMICIIM